MKEIRREEEIQPPTSKVSFVSRLFVSCLKCVWEEKRVVHSTNASTPKSGDPSAESEIVRKGNSKSKIQGKDKDNDKDKDKGQGKI